MVPRFVDGVTPCSGGDLERDIVRDTSIPTPVLLIVVIFVVDIEDPKLMKLVSFGFLLKACWLFS